MRYICVLINDVMAVRATIVMRTLITWPATGTRTWAMRVNNIGAIVICTLSSRGWPEDYLG